MKAMRRRLALPKHSVRNNIRRRFRDRDSFGGVTAHSQCAGAHESLLLPLRFLQLLPYLAFFMAHVVQLALEKR